MVDVVQPGRDRVEAKNQLLKVLLSFLVVIEFNQAVNHLTTLIQDLNMRDGNAAKEVQVWHQLVIVKLLLAVHVNRELITVDSMHALDALEELSVFH